MLEKVLKEIEQAKREPWYRLNNHDVKIRIDRVIERIIDIIRNCMDKEWTPVDERLPEDEARKYIEKELNGIGYLYPCLLTYRSPITEKIHVVRFYYDMYEHWFVNAREEVCEKERCIAWQPLPEPYQPER